MDTTAIQTLLKEYDLDGWLFTDFQGRDPITHDFLKLTDRKCTRRLFYYIPAAGQPVKVLSAIEPLLLDHLPGKKFLYKGIQGQREVLAHCLPVFARRQCPDHQYHGRRSGGIFEDIRDGADVLSRSDAAFRRGADRSPD